jgi:hypothetical protein
MGEIFTLFKGTQLNLSFILAMAAEDNEDFAEVIFLANEYLKNKSKN